MRNIRTIATYNKTWSVDAHIEGDKRGRKDMDDLAWVVSGSNPELFSKLHRSTNQWELSEKCQNVNRCATIRPNGTLAGIRGEASVC